MNSPLDAKAKDHERIWLQNVADVDPNTGRMWCEDKVWPEDDEEGEPTEYVRADIITTHAERIAELEREIQGEKDHIAHADAYQKAAMDNLARAEGAEAENAKLHEALDVAITETKRLTEINANHCRTVNSYILDNARQEDLRKAAEAEVAKLREALALARSLTPKCGGVTILQVLAWRNEGTTFQEIANRVGVTKAAVWSAINHARALTAKGGE